MIGLPYRRSSRLVVALLILGGGRVSGQTQTPGQVTKFDPSLNVVDSVITEDAVGNVGIGSTTPAAKLDVAGGNLNLEDSSVAAGNVLKGGELFIHNVGNENTFIGIRAGKVMMTGAGGNTASGFEALENNITGRANTASGTRALEQNTTGFFNTATGFHALQSNIDGQANTASGVFALLSNTSGFQNTASGLQALFSNTSGFENTASGVFALFSNNGGFENTATGIQALVSNTSGSDNTGIGGEADVTAGDLTNATAIGFRAKVDASNKIRLGNNQVTVIEGQVPYTFTSDRNQKENFQPVDGEAVLRKVGGLNLTSWNYIGHDPHQLRHYGPVAQEFFAAFGQDAVGTIGTPTTINSGDLEGILMVAVQALEKRTAENADLRARIEALEKLVKGTTTQDQ
jgi:hypothetical protein